MVMERLSGLDASFLYLETPTMQMHVAFVIICDTRSNPDGYRFSALAERIESRVNREPAFRRKLVQVPFNLNHPLWIEDGEFSILNHLRQY
ncbi:wax ester/triacylglycerol synthase family O-acyltransferase, partial [Arthrospira platensis SPKY1]|nr:wax ester/triacylglycerol synthase family O-acyltransferase [Arthrospira platensis SPKY1]